MTPAFSVSIYPDGNREKLNRLAFDSKEEKDAYLMKEFKACIMSFNTYHDALKKQNRDAEQKVMDLARVRFAVSEGFTPTKLRGTLWVKQEKLLNK